MFGAAGHRCANGGGERWRERRERRRWRWISSLRCGSVSLVAGHRAVHGKEGGEDEGEAYASDQLETVADSHVIYLLP